MQPPAFIGNVVAVFRKHEAAIATQQLVKGLTSGEVLDRLRADLQALGFDVEQGKKSGQKIKAPPKGRLQHLMFVQFNFYCLRGQ